MGFSYQEFLDLTWAEFYYYTAGYERRLERQWDYTRHVIASNFNSSGFSKKTIRANDIMKLPHLDSPTKPVFKRVDPERLKSMLYQLDNKEK